MRRIVATIKPFAKYMGRLLRKKDVSLKEAELVEKVQEEMPVLFNQFFVHIINADPGSRDHLISQYAKR